MEKLNLLLTDKQLEELTANNILLPSDYEILHKNVKYNENNTNTAISILNKKAIKIALNRFFNAEPKEIQLQIKGLHYENSITY